MEWNLDRIVGVVGLLLSIIALLVVFSPFRKYVDRFNNWFDTRGERGKQRLESRIAKLEKDKAEIESLDKKEALDITTHFLLATIPLWILGLTCYLGARDFLHFTDDGTFINMFLARILSGLEAGTMIAMLGLAFFAVYVSRKYVQVVNGNAVLLIDEEIKRLKTKLGKIT